MMGLFGCGNPPIFWEYTLLSFCEWCFTFAFTTYHTTPRWMKNNGSCTALFTALMLQNAIRSAQKSTTMRAGKILCATLSMDLLREAKSMCFYDFWRYLAPLWSAIYIYSSYSDLGGMSWAQMGTLSMSSMRSFDRRLKVPPPELHFWGGVWMLTFICGVQVSILSSALSSLLLHHFYLSIDISTAPRTNRFLYNDP
jgi:hypothetical protein